ncbi:MAG: YjbQ family protein [Burkholderiaceae bacterium]|nr:YjbQ family protein [Burkholderiaceae bacterium]
MPVEHRRIIVETPGRGTVRIDERIARELQASGLSTGLCHVFLQHTSASLVLTENADPDVRTDLETIYARAAPDGDPAYRHDAEGPDDMAAHARAALGTAAICIPFADRRLMLGTWQGLFVWEHRHRGHRRHLVLTLIGEP